mmetsp:Transcript_59745/g.102898  ORF Transcript_59745/g.102898 Transcript_59745/m.102898 type:complete len:124 (-) Transcript_59745:18-389(-)
MAVRWVEGAHDSLFANIPSPTTLTKKAATAVRFVATGATAAATYCVEHDRFRKLLLLQFWLLLFLLFPLLAENFNAVPRRAIAEGNVNKATLILSECIPTLPLLSLIQPVAVITMIIVVTTLL